MSSDIHALSGAYAVDALDDLERARFETHLASCADCRAEVASLQDAAGLLSATTETAPPPALRARVLDEISRVRPLPPISRAPETPWWRRPVLLVAAALVIIAGLGAASVLQPWRDEPLSATEQVLAAPDAQRFSLSLEGAQATVVRSEAERHAVIVTQDMPPPPAGKAYQLWLQTPGGEMVSAGLMPPGRDQTLMLDGDAATATAAGITVEPKAGSSSPTSDPIALFDFSEPT